jgi:TonB family protein
VRKLLRYPLVLITLTACGVDGADQGDPPESSTEPGFEAPVLINPESPVEYPLDLFEQEVEASVILRLYLTEQGIVVPESTKVAESSGYPPLDSAALAGISSMSFAPARQDGRPVATLFLQPIHFKHPARSESGEIL